MLNAPQALEPLKAAFDRVDTVKAKSVIAVAVLSLGEPDGPYFDYLRRLAQPVVSSDMPFPVAVDVRGEVLFGQLSEEFEAWCRERNLDPPRTARRAVYEDAATLLALAQAREPRFRDLLLQALGSNNYFHRLRAAEGLAILEDADSIPIIVEMIPRLPRQFRESMAATLMLFDHPAAHEAARRWIKDEERLQSSRAQLRQMVPGKR